MIRRRKLSRGHRVEDLVDDLRDVLGGGRVGGGARVAHRGGVVLRRKCQLANKVRRALINPSLKQSSRQMAPIKG